MTVEIQTIDDGENKGTISVILVDDVVCCFCLELPWRNNEQDISCIPAGEYPLVLEYSKANRMPLYEFKRVPNRSEVKFHIGNYLNNTLGCPLPGMEVRHSPTNKQYSVGESTRAFDKFMDMMGGRIKDTVIVSGRPTLN